MLNTFEKNSPCSAIERRIATVLGHVPRHEMKRSWSFIRISRRRRVNLPERGNGTSEFHFSSSLLSSEVSPSGAVLEAAIERALALTSLTFMPVIFHAGQTFRRMMHYLGCNSGRARPGPRGTNAREMGQEHPAECRSSSGRSIDLQT